WRSNSSGVINTATGLPCWVITRGRWTSRSLCNTWAARALKTPRGKISSDTCSDFTAVAPQFRLKLSLNIVQFFSWSNYITPYWQDPVRVSLFPPPRLSPLSQPWRDCVGAGPSGPFPATASAEGRLIKGGPSPTRGEGVEAPERSWEK